MLGTWQKTLLIYLFQGLKVKNSVEMNTQNDLNKDMWSCQIISKCGFGEPVIWYVLVSNVMLQLK